MRAIRAVSRGDILFGVGGMAARIVPGLVFLLCVGLILLRVRRARVGRPQSDMPDVVLLVGIMIMAIPQVVTLPTVAHLVTVIVASAILVFGVWRQSRSRRRRS